MALQLHHLDEATRRHILNEIDHDLGTGRLYVSPRLTDECANVYADLLKEAAKAGNEESLALELAQTGRLKSHEPRKTKNGVSLVKVPVTAHQTLAEGEFNRFYMRGLCARAKEEGHTHVVVYRAKHVDNPREESELLIGTTVEVAALLNDLREHVGVDTALGLPSGPNSGLSIRFSDGKVVSEATEPVILPDSVA